MKNLILSGGTGSRLWPLSRQLMPKQFLKLFDNRSLFQKTIGRNKNITNDFFIITNEEHYFIALDQLDEINEKGKFLLEGEGRNTAVAIALAALQCDKEKLLLVTPADHLIEDEESYFLAVQRGKELAAQGFLVTFGIKPDSPETGYGYIEAQGEDVKQFIEKPSLEKARKFIAKNNFYWNSGIFLFKAGVFLEELKKYRKDIYDGCKKAVEKAKKSDNLIRVPAEVMKQIPAESIDYAIMEKSNRVKVVPSNFKWSDLGSFDTLSKHLKTSPYINLESKDNFLISKKQVAMIGVKDLIVVDTEDALLIVKKGESQKVKEVVQKLGDNDIVKFHKKVYRPWGTYEVLIDEKGYKIKRITVKPKKRLSLQKHFHRNEHWIVVSGTAEVQVGDKTFLLRPNESTYIKMGEIHRLSNPGKIPVVLIEAQVGEYTKEDDIIRLEDDFLRE